MSMYLPNPALQPTGSEITEFLDVPPMAETSDEAFGPFKPLASSTLELDSPTSQDPQG